MGGDANIARDQTAASALGESRDAGYVRIPFPPRRHGVAPLSRIARAQNALVSSWAGQASMRAFRRLRPGSRIRRRGFVWGVQPSLKTLLAYERKGLAAFYEPDAEIVVPPWPGLAERFTGADGFMDFFEGWTEGWDQVELEVVEVFDLGERSLVFGWMYTRGGTSGVATCQPFSSMHDYSASKISRGEWFMSWEEGLEAAGLEGERLPD